MGLTSAIRSLLIKQAPTDFDELDADTGQPSRDFSGAIAWDVDRASITTYGEHAANERDDIRSGFHGVPPDAETIVDDEGAPIERRTGQVQVDLTLRTLGPVDPADVPFLWALGTGLTPLGYPNAAAVTVATEVGSGQFSVADAIAAADLPTGGMVAYMPTVGPAAFSAIVKKVSAAGATTVDLSPLLPKATLEEDDVVRTCAVFGSLPGRALGPAVDIRADGHGWRSYAFRCRLESAVIKSEGRRLRATLTFVPALIQTAHSEVDSTGSNIARAPSRVAGSAVLHTLGAAVTLSDRIEDATNAPRIGGRTVICPDEWQVTITNTLSPDTCWGTVLGMSDMSVTQRTCEVALTLADPVAAVAGDFKARAHRSLAMSWGPLPGMGLILPAAYLTADPGARELGGDRVRQVLNYREGLPLTVTALGGEGTDHLANSPILLGLGLTAES